MMVTVASRALAAQISFPSGEMSKPSAPWPAGTFVTSQVRRGPPGGATRSLGAPAGGGPAGPPPGGGPKPPFGCETCSMMLMVRGVDIRSHDAVEALGDGDHVGAILAGAENPIHALGRGIVTADDFIRLRGEIEFAAGEVQAVSGAHRAEVDGRQRLARDEIDHRDGVESAVGAAVV